jgi:hypothetical protein
MDMEAIPMMFYAQWYNEDVKKHLTKEQKEKLMRKISDISLEKPIFMAGIDFDKKDFPELAPYSHTEKISGLQLYAVMTEIFNELYKGKNIPRPYPTFPSVKEKKKKELKKVV